MPETVFDIEREETGSAGRYVIHLPDGSEAEMTYRKTAPGTITIDHTGVPPAWRRDGLALKLLETAIADARAKATQIVPVCSYVVAQFKRHPEWADLLAS